MSEHFDLADAARFLAMDTSALLALIDAGELPAHRQPPHQPTVKKSDVLAYLRKSQGEKHGQRTHGY